MEDVAEYIAHAEYARRTKAGSETHLAGIEKHGAGFIAERGRVQGLPVRASDASPGRDRYNWLQPGSVYIAPALRYNWRD